MLKLAKAERHSVGKAGAQGLLYREKMVRYSCRNRQNCTPASSCPQPSTISLDLNLKPIVVPGKTVWLSHSQSITMKKFNRKETRPKAIGQDGMSLAPVPGQTVHGSLTSGLLCPNPKLGYFLIYSKTQAKDFGMPQEALGHGIFGGCVHDSGGHLFTQAIKKQTPLP